MALTFSAWFWNERFWLPVNTTWADLRNTDEISFAQASDVLIMFPYSLVLYAIRILVERFIARPVGRKLNISDTPSKPPSRNVVLDKVFYSITNNPEGERLKGLCKQLDWSERQVQRWFRRKNNINRPSKLVKFSETFWRFVFYLGIFVLGNVALHHANPKCMFQNRECWVGYPDKQPLLRITYWYYQSELAFYTMCSVSQFFDIKRKDFWIMFSHHIATILLISFSYCINMLNIGMLIMLVHDFSDIFLEASKIAKYSQQDGLGTCGLVMFAITFGLARLVYFPLCILNSIWFDAWAVVGPFPSWYFFCCCLAVLQALHVYWFSFIVKGFLALIRQGGTVDDIRSESESDEQLAFEGGDASSNNGTAATLRKNK